MGLSDELAAGFNEAQGLLAQAGGAAAGANNSLYNAAAYIAVYGNPQPQNQMLPSGGWRQRTVVPCSVTRAQFTTAPAAKTKWTRTDLDAPITYIIDKVDFHDPYFYGLTLVKLGE